MTSLGMRIDRRSSHSGVQTKQKANYEKTGGAGLTLKPVDKVVQLTEFVFEDGVDNGIL